MKDFFSKPYGFYLALLPFGISLGFNFQITYLSSVFKFFGAQASQLSYLWLAPAITGLLVQPIIGQISDVTKARYKRRPYMLGSGALAVLSFILIPYAHNLLCATLLIWLLSASVNGCMAMWRALTTDLTPPNEISKTFAYHAVLAGIGTAVGVGLPYLVDLFFGNKAGQLKTLKLPLNLQLSFIISGMVLASVLVIYAIKIKEPLNDNTPRLDKNERGKLFLFQLIATFFGDLARELKKSSFEFKKLCLLNTITAFGVFIFWIYFISALAQNFYSLPIGVAEANMSSHTLLLLQKATSASSGYLSIGQLANVAYAFLMFFLLAHTKKIKLIYGVSLLIGGAGIVFIGFAHTPTMLIIAMLGMGILIESFSILPFAIVSHLFPKGKNGVYFGLFNISITLPQVIGGLTLSPAYLTIFGGSGANMMFFAGGLILLSAVLWLKEACGRY